MRQADIHRIEKAITHLDAACTLMHSIKWERTSQENEFMKQAEAFIRPAKWSLQDIININKVD